MRLPNAAFKIGERALHSNSGFEGTIAGIQRHPSGETLQYLFDCDKFTQWLTIGKLERLEKAKLNSLDEDGEIEYKVFDVAFIIMRENQLITVTVHLTNDIGYELKFPLAHLEQAKGLHGYLSSVGTVTESLLSAIGMTKV